MSFFSYSASGSIITRLQNDFNDFTIPTKHRFNAFFAVHAASTTSKHPTFPKTGHTIKAHPNHLPVNFLFHSKPACLRGGLRICRIESFSRMLFSKVQYSEVYLPAQKLKMLRYSRKFTKCKAKRQVL